MKGKIKAFGKIMEDAEYLEFVKNKHLKRLNNVKPPKISKRQQRLL